MLSRLDADEQKYSEGIARLEPLLDRSAPHAEILMTLAKLKLLDDKPQQAAELCELGATYYTWQPDFVRGLAAADGQLGDEKRLSRRRLFVRAGARRRVPRKRLAEVALKQGRFADAIRLAKSALYVDVLDAEIHRDLGAAYLGAKRVKQALPAIEAAVELKPKDDDLELAFAKVLAAAGRSPRGPPTSDGDSRPRRQKCRPHARTRRH